jgi:predicted MFS family arabinose efflux permease
MIPKSAFIRLNTFHVINDGLYDSVPILLSFIFLAYGAGEREVGLVTSFAAAISAIFSLSTVWVSRNLRMAHVFALLSTLYGIGFLANSAAQSILFSGLFFVLALCGHGLFHTMAFSYISAHTERHCLGKVMSNFTAIGDIGRIPLVSFAGFAAAFSIWGIPGWRFVCFSYGVTAILVAIWLLLSVRNFPDRLENNETSEKARTRRLPSFVLLRDKDVALPMLSSTLNAFSSDRVFTFLPLLLFAKGIEPERMGSFALGFILGSCLGKMACGRLVDRFGTRPVFLASSLLMAVLLLVLVAVDDFFLIVVTALILGIVTRGAVPVVQTIITEPESARHNYAEIFSMNNFFRGSINVLTPLLFGFVGAAFDMHWSFCIMAGGALLAAVPVLLIRQRPKD